MGKGIDCLKKQNIAIVGCTGLVGQMMLKVLAEREFPVETLYLMASNKSAGSKMTYRDHDYQVEELIPESFNHDIDLAFFTAGAKISEEYAPLAASLGITVIDNSSAFRTDDAIPLVVPEVNAEDIKKHLGIISNPNCSTIQAVIPLKKLAETFGLKRVVYSTYQAVSGSGKDGVIDLEAGLKGLPPKFYPHPIVNNCLPQIDDFVSSGPYEGYSREEVKMIMETRKILHLPNLPVSATTVRVPVLNGHSISVNVELARSFTIEQVKKLWTDQPGLIVIDDYKYNFYPTPLIASGTDLVYVGRIRRDFSVDHGLNFWVVADNLRKGAATNAVQIAELLLKEQGDNVV